jgi:hypothetical protein
VGYAPRVALGRATLGRAALGNHKSSAYSNDPNFCIEKILTNLVISSSDMNDSCCILNTDMKNYGCIEPLLDGSGINYQLASKGILGQNMRAGQ